MTKPSPFPNRIATGLWLIPAALAFTCWTGLTGCKSVDIENAAADTSTAAASDSANLRVTNKIDIDPGTLSLILFPGKSVDIVNANRTKKLGEIPFGATKTLRVPAGTWKLAYENRAGALRAMVNEESATQDWVKAIFIKDMEYALILTTDGNDVVWQPSFTTDPALH
jgi:hypothetical protein